VSEPPTFAEIKERLATLRAERDAAAGGAAPPAAQPTADQLEAMRETMGILSEPAMLARVKQARRAVAAADVVSLEDLTDVRPATRRQWRVVLAGSVARELTEGSRSSDPAVLELLDTLGAEPSQGRALGFGLAGMRSLHNGPYRVIYAIDDERRGVTVLSVDQAS
jgi:mRNA-degrading endonuclease RelE of RelBE toxin-antitoxin system